MKPSVILYKALPDDLLQRLQEHFTVHQVANLSPQTVEQNAAIFAEAEGLLGSNENVDAALLEKMPKLRATSTISVGYDNFDVRCAYRPKNSADAHANRINRNRRRYADGAGVVYRSSGCGGSRTGKSRRMDREHRPGLVRH